jgi:hypothetical protein
LTRIEGPIMKLIAIIVGAALLTAAPVTLQSTPRKAGLYVDKAEARVAHRRRPSYGYYGVPYYGAAYPRYGYPPAYYGVLPYGIPPYPYSPDPPTGGFFLGTK